MKRTFDTESRPLMTCEFRDYRPTRIPLPLRNHVQTPPRVESSPIAAIYPQDLDRPAPGTERTEPPWRNRHAKRR